MLGHHRRPQRHVQAVGSWHTLHHGGGPEPLKDTADACFVPAVHFRSFVEGERLVSAQEILEQPDGQRFSMQFFSRAFPQEAEVVHPMGQPTPFRRDGQRPVVHHPEHQPRRFGLAQFHRQVHPPTVPL